MPIKPAYDSWNCKIICYLKVFFNFSNNTLLFYNTYNYFFGGGQGVSSNKRTYFYFTFEKNIATKQINVLTTNDIRHFYVISVFKDNDTDITSFVRRRLWAAFLDGDGPVLCTDYLTVTVVVNSAVYIKRPASLALIMTQTISIFAFWKITKQLYIYKYINVTICDIHLSIMRRIYRSSYKKE